jgi:hypothetical protein
LQSSLATTRQILADYPDIAIVSPSGEIALGYPDMTPLVSLLKERNLPVAQTEFSRQLGASQLNWLSFPRLIPLHSVTNEELLVRRISRTALHERFVRAAVERSVRLLVLRPAVSGNVTSALEHFGQEVEDLVDDLRAHGLQIGWPKSVFAERPGWSMSWMSALACSLIFLLSLARYVKRMSGARDMLPNPLAFVVLSLFLAFAVYKAAIAARLVGAFAAALVVTEVSLMAMENSDRQWLSLLKAAFFALTGGLAIAALFSEPIYMLRLSSFSGVKLTLMLPPLLIVLHDMHRRVHPESLSEFLSRPPIWGEFFLGVTLLALLGLVLFRSDNVQFIPGIEARIRNALERLLIARPRNREVFIGYPCLLIYAFAVKAKLWGRYREVLRVGVVLGFASVINSFCHYHTPLLFILLREFHGLWTGTLLGLVSVFILKFAVLPLWRRVRFLTE